MMATKGLFIRPGGELKEGIRIPWLNANESSWKKACCLLVV